MFFAGNSLAFTSLYNLIKGVNEGEDSTLLGGFQIGHQSVIHEASARTDPNFNEEQRLLEAKIKSITLFSTWGYRTSDDRRVEALEIFSPIGQSIESTTPSENIIPAITHDVIGYLTVSHRMKMMLHLAQDGQTFDSGIRPIAKELEIMTRDFLYGSKLSDHENFTQFKIVLMTVLGYLQHEGLKTYERLWTLSVLRRIQSLLPWGHLHSIRQDPNTGWVCRGGLELFLTEGQFW